MRHLSRVRTPPRDHAEQGTGGERHSERARSRATLMPDGAGELFRQLGHQVIRRRLEIRELLAQTGELALLAQITVHALSGRRIAGEPSHHLTVAPAVELTVHERLQIVLGNGASAIDQGHGYLTTRNRATAPCVMS